MIVSRARPVFGSLPRAPRPIVLLIVFGLFLAVLGVTTTAQTILVSAHFSNAALNEILGSDSGTVRSFVNLNLLNEDLTGTASAARRQALAGNRPGVARSQWQPRAHRDPVARRHGRGKRGP